METSLTDVLEAIGANEVASEYHFFRRSDGYYSCYGSQAKVLARSFFGTERVVRKEGEGLDSLNLSRVHFSKVAHRILSSNVSLSIWRDSAEGGGWCEYKASPGNMSGIEDDIDINTQQDLASSVSIAAISCEESDNCIQVGIAIVSTCLGTIELLEFMDTFDFGNLEAVLVQRGVRECLIRGSGSAAPDSSCNSTPAATIVDTTTGTLGRSIPTGSVEQELPQLHTTSQESRPPQLIASLQQVLQRVGVLVRKQHSSIFTLRSTCEVLSQLECLCIGHANTEISTISAGSQANSDTGSATGTGSGNADIGYETKTIIEGICNNMTIALGSANALLRYLELYGNDREYGCYQIKQGFLRDVLLYDTSVSRALAIFPDIEASSSSSIVHLKLHQQPHEATAASATTASATTDIDEGGGGGNDNVEHKPAVAVAAADTLFGLLNVTKTFMGSRLLRQWLQQPSRDIDIVKKRHDVVESLVNSPAERALLREDDDYLPKCPDLIRLVRKLRSKHNIGLTPAPTSSSSSSTASSPSSSLFDLVMVYRCLLKLRSISSLLGTLNLPPSVTDNTDGTPSGPKDAAWMKRANIAEKLKWRSEQCSKLVELVEDLLDTERLAAGRKKDCIWRQKWIQVRFDMNQELEGIHSELCKSRASIGEEFRQLVSVTGLPEKDVHLTRRDPYGICVRITKKKWSTASKKLKEAKRDAKVFTTLKAGVFFASKKFAELASAYDALATKYEEAQSVVIADALEVAVTYEHVLISVAGLISEVDCLSSLAHVAASLQWTRPDIIMIPATTAAVATTTSTTTAMTAIRAVAVAADGVDETFSASRQQGELLLVIKDLRHPIVEAHIGSDRYVASDVRMGGDDGKTVIITGPNCGGKSTFIRAVGLCVLIAHIGSFVPASSARIPIMDCIMTRVGAADSTVRGISTFMREMLDVCAMLRRATSSSLVIIDELGRGTSTEDGFGIAWAVLEHLAKRVKCFVLFATHFHEITAIADEVSGVRNCRVGVGLLPPPGGMIRSSSPSLSTSPSLYHHSPHTAPLPVAGGDNNNSSSSSSSSSRGDNSAAGNGYHTSNGSYSSSNLLTFLFKVEPGVCSKSYGVDVARLADFPQEIVRDAEAISASLERSSATYSSSSTSPVTASSASAEQQQQLSPPAKRSRNE